MMWLTVMESRVDLCLKEFESNPRLDMDKYLNLCIVLEDVYNTFFPMPVSYILKNDLKNGEKVIRESSMNDDPNGERKKEYIFLEDMVDNQIQLYGRYECENRYVNGTKSLLWMNRGLQFFHTLIRNLLQNIPSSEAGYKTYEEVLLPYHGWMTQKVVGNALSYAPPISNILEKIGVDEREGRQRFETLQTKLKLVSDMVTDLLIRYCANFQSKV